MKLKQISIKNFRGLKGDKNVILFDRSDIIFLIGQNDVGKSTFLQAFKFFIDPKQKACITDFYDENDNVPIEIEAWFTKELKDDDDPNLQENNKNKKDEPNRIDKWVDDKNLIKIKKIWKNTIDSFEKKTFNPESKEWEDNGFRSLHQNLTKYVPHPIFINAIETPESLEKEVNDLIKNFLEPSLQKDSHEDIQNRIRKLQNKILSSEDIQQINNSMNEEFKEVFPQLKLKINPKEDEIGIQKLLAKNHSLTLQKDGEDKPNNFKQHGHGVFRQAFFNALKALIPYNTNSHSFLILFEEPEVFLHPKAILKLRKMLYELAEKPRFQILCATHSPLMIDLSSPHTSLVRIKKDMNTDITETINLNQTLFNQNNELNNYVKMINLCDLHFCDAFFADKVLLAEGITEVIVFRYLLNNYFPNEKISIVNAGGKSNIIFFQKILMHFEIEYAVFHDSDTKYDKKGEITKNSSDKWNLNQEIWNLVQKANTLQAGLARRYVSIEDFDKEHKCGSVDKSKMYRAHELAESINETNKEKLSCYIYLNDWLGEQKILHDQTYIKEKLTEFTGTKAEGKRNEILETTLETT